MARCTIQREAGGRVLRIDSSGVLLLVATRTLSRRRLIGNPDGVALGAGNCRVRSGELKGGLVVIKRCRLPRGCRVA